VPSIFFVCITTKKTELLSESILLVCMVRSSLSDFVIVVKVVDTPAIQRQGEGVGPHRVELDQIKSG